MQPSEKNNISNFLIMEIEINNIETIAIVDSY
jgi:hypothetical protein